MAAATLAARGTGFVRTAVIVAAVGTGGVATAYSLANTIPNIVYDLLLGGILSSVVVPVLVTAARDDSDGGRRLANALLTLTGLALGVVVVIGVFAAPSIVSVYLPRTTGPHGDAREFAEAVTLTRFFLPQVLCYGLAAVATAILNVRNRFVAPMATPILNNVIVVTTAALVLAMPGREVIRGGGLTHAQTLVLGLGTTAGVLAMALGLLPALRRSGLRYRPVWDLRIPGLAQAARLAGWVAAYVVTNQIGYLVITRLATSAADHGDYAVYSYAYSLFQLPYAVVAVTVITALLPRMARSARDGRPERVRADLSRGLRTAATILVPVAGLGAVLGPSLTTLFFAHGVTGLAGARGIGTAFAAFALGLVPFAGFQLAVRTYYSMRDTRTPAAINFVGTAANVGFDYALIAILPPEHRVVALALGFSLSYLLAAGIALWAVGRRLDGADGGRVGRLVVRVAVATGAAAGVAGAGVLGSGALVGSGRTGSLLALAVGGTGGLLVYLRIASLLRIREVSWIAGSLRPARRAVRPPDRPAASG